MKTMLRVLKYIGVFAILIALFNVSLYLACSFDSRLLEVSASESAEILREQGLKRNICYLLNITNDNNADTLIINEMFSVDSSEPYVSYMKARKNYRKGQTTAELPEPNGEGVSVLYLAECVDENDPSRTINDYCSAQYHDSIRELNDFLGYITHTSVSYGRYWHGYLTLYRPLSVWFNIAYIRYIMLAVLCVLFAYAMYLLNGRFGKCIALIFGSSLLFTGYFTASISLECAPVFLVMMLSAIVLVKRIDKIRDFYLYLFAVACITNFVDYLTVPLATLGALCGLYLLKLCEEGRDWKYCLKFVVFSSLIWLLGYAGTWAFKWVQYDLTITNSLGAGKSMIQTALDQCMYRMTRVNNSVGYTDNKIVYIVLNILGKASLYALIVFSTVLYLNRFNVNMQGLNKRSLSFLLLALSPAVWYIALANHTAAHYFFTYRHSFVYMFGVLLALNEMFFGRSEETGTAET